MIDPPDITYYGNDEFEHPHSSTLNDDQIDPPELSLEFSQDNQPFNVSGISIDTPNTSNVADDSPKKKNNRSFMKRSRYKRYHKKLNRRALPSLVNNFSSLKLDENMESLLNKSLNFVPTPKRLDKTNIEAGLQKFKRSLLWHEYWHDSVNSTQSDNNKLKQVFFDKSKTNLPPSSHHIPVELSRFIHAVHSDIVGSKSLLYRKNLTKKEEEALEFLVKSQKDSIVTIKPNDKTGGCSILNTEDYIAAFELMLNKVIVDEQGNNTPCYERDVSVDVLKDHWRQVKEVVEKGIKDGYIHPKDKPFLVPDNAKCGRLYGLVKDHAAKEKWLHNGKIPPLRPVVSMSGTNTEGLAHWLDVIAKPLVPKLPSFIEDTRHMLQIIEDTNKKGPQSPDIIPVVIDVNDMYGSIPWEEGLIAFEEAITDINTEYPLIISWRLSRLFWLVTCLSLEGKTIYSALGLLWV
jgi:hypothetical protein